MSQPKLRFFDTHAHLTDEAFAADVSLVINRAFNEDITQMVSIGLDEESSRRAQQLAHQYKIWFTAGVHPSESAKITTDSIKGIEELLSDERCVGVGEIGLDYYWPDPPPPPQIRCFHQMLEIASRTRQPVIIHQRNSYEDVLRILDEYQLEGKGIFHCFGGSVEQVKEVTSRGFYVSFAGNVTYKKAQMEETIRAVPLERLLIETDCPYLAPVPFRGKRNEPAYVKFTATTVAEILRLSLEELSRIMYKNSMTVFGINH